MSTSSQATDSLTHTEKPNPESEAENEPLVPDATFSFVGSKEAADAPPIIITIPRAVITPPMINNTLPAVCMMHCRAWTVIVLPLNGGSILVQSNFLSFSGADSVDGN